MTDPVVPIRPGVQLTDDRAIALLEHVAAKLAAFPDIYGEEPLNIAFVIEGKDGLVDTGWLIEGKWRSALAMAGAVLLHDAASPATDARNQGGDPNDAS